MISIHVPMRARRTEINSTGDFVNFNPRAHEGTTGLPGARRQAAYISIHVPMRARRHGRRRHCVVPNFNPRAHEGTTRKKL